MKRLIVALMVGGALFAGVAFAAASLSLNAGNLSQGASGVTDCAQGYTVSLSWEVTGANPVNVYAVDVNAPSMCAGATAVVEVSDGATVRAAATCTLDGNGDCDDADVVPDTDVGLVNWAIVTLAGP
jgi:hypothetical protein